MKLKLFFSVMTMLFAVGAAAAELRLQSGETAYVRPNVETYVTCEGADNGGSCAEKIASFDSKMTYCKRSSTNDYCFNRFWPAFKSESPNCFDQAFETCMRHCTVSSTNDYCLNRCTTK